MADETRKILIDIEVDDKDFDESLGKINVELKENREQIKELSKDYKSNATEIAKLERANKELSNTKRQLTKESQTEANSLNALRLQLINLTAERNNLDTSIAGNSERFNQLQKEIKETSSEIKGFEEAGGDFRRNVGNYQDSLSSAAAEQEVFGVSLNKIKTLFTSTAGLIGAGVAVISGLAKAYTSSARGAEDLARANDRLDSVIKQVGNSIADAFGDDAGNGILDRALGTLQLLVAGTSSFVSSQLAVFAQAQLRELEVVEIQEQRTAKNRLDRAEELRQIRDEERNSIPERAKANQDLEAIITKREEKLIAFQEKRLVQLRRLLSLDKENTELRKAVAQAEFEIADIQEEAQGFRSEALANDLALSREVSEQRVALTTAQIQEEIILAEEGSKEKLDLEIQLIDETSRLQIEAAGENALKIQTIEQESFNARLALFKTFQEQQTALINEGLPELEKRTGIEIDLSNEEFETRLNNEAKIAQAKSRFQSQQKAARQRDIQNQAQFLNIISGQLSASLRENSIASKALALTQVGINTAQAITKGIAEFGPPPSPPGIAAIASASAIGIAQAANILRASPSSSSGGGSTNVSASSASSSVIQPSLLSQFSAPVQSQNDLINAASSDRGPTVVSVVDITKAQKANIVKVGQSGLG